MSNPERPQITGLHTVGVPVTDQDRALQFYVGTLGLEPRMDVPMGGGQRWIEVAPAGAATTLALVAAHEGVPAGVETGIRLTAGSADTLHAGLVARGVDVGEVLRWPGVPPMFAFRDPDGNGLEIVEDARA
jgi:lactoylglutathione lyase